MSFPVTPNMQCFDGNLEPIPQNFDLKFKPRGNFTFTFNEAKLGDVPYLCSPMFFVIKELVRRTQYNAIPVIVDPNNNITFMEEVIGPHFGALFNNETDLYISDRLTITPLIESFARIASFSVVEPIIVILGGVYPVHYDNLISSFYIFDFYIWLSLIVSLLFTSTIISFNCNLNNSNTKLIEFSINSVLENIWHLFESSFLGETSKELQKNIKEFIFIYLTFFLMAFTLLKAFSSSILSTTIRKPFTVIDSIDDLMIRKDLEPFIYMSRIQTSKIQKLGDIREKKLLERALRNTNPDMVYSSINFVYAKDELTLKIFHQKTNVLISPVESLRLISDGKSKFSHIAANKYFDTLAGTVFSKYLNKSIADTYNKLLYDMVESGCYAKWIECIQVFAGSQFTEFTDKFSPYEEIGHKVQVKPALGPALTNVSIAIIVFLLELLTNNNLLATHLRNPDKLFTHSSKFYDKSVLSKRF